MMSDIVEEAPAGGAPGRRHFTSPPQEWREERTRRRVLRLMRAWGVPREEHERTLNAMFVKGALAGAVLATFTIVVLQLLFGGIR